MTKETGGSRADGPHQIGQDGGDAIAEIEDVDKSVLSGFFLKSLS